MAVKGPRDRGRLRRHRAHRERDDREQRGHRHQHSSQPVVHM